MASEIFVPSSKLSTFDYDLLTITKPVKKSFSNNTYLTSDIRTKNGEKVFINLPKKDVFMRASFDFNSSNIVNGCQIFYSVCEASANVFDKLSELVTKYVEKYCEEGKLPKKYRKAEMKPLYRHSDDKQTSFLKLITKGKGDNIRCETNVYNSDGETIDIDISDFLEGKRGNSNIVIYLKGIYYSCSKSEDDFISVQLQVYEMMFEEIETSIKPSNSRFI